MNRIKLRYFLIMIRSKLRLLFIKRSRYISLTYQEHGRPVSIYMKALDTDLRQSQKRMLISGLEAAKSTVEFEKSENNSKVLPMIHYSLEMRNKELYLITIQLILIKYPNKAH